MVFNRLRRRRIRKKTTLRKKVQNKQITKVVKSVLHRNIENKYAMKYLNRMPVNTNMGGVIGIDTYNIIPDLQVGITGQQGERVGNRVKPLSLSLSMNFFPNRTTPETDWGAYGAYFDLYVYSIKGQKRALSDVSTYISGLLRPSIFGSNDDTLYQGQPQNWFQTINDDNIVCLHRKRFRISNPYDTNGVNSASNGGTLFKDYSVSLSKKVLKTLSYSDEFDRSPNNQAIYATMVCTKSDNSLQDPDPNNWTLGTVNMSSKLVYEDP